MKHNHWVVAGTYSQFPSLLRAIPFAQYDVFTLRLYAALLIFILERSAWSESHV